MSFWSFMIIANLLMLIGAEQSITSKSPEVVKGSLTNVTEEEVVPFDPSKGRLPLSLKPFHYDLRLQPFIHGNRSIHGEIKINFVVNQNTKQIIINMNDIITLNETCEVTCLTNSPKIVNHTYDAYNQFYTATLDTYLTKGSQCSFSMKFLGYLNDKLVGFYFASYNDNDGNEHKIAMTQFSPTDARRAFPCFDEPGFKATFNISLVRRNNMTALSNMPIISSEPAQTGWMEDKFDTTLKMSTYLVGFLISDFAYIETDVLNGTVFKIWSRKDAIDQGNFSLTIGPKMLKSLENYFNINYPLPKLDMAAVPSFKFNGMENWGLIMFRESALLVDPQLTTVKIKRNMVVTLAHEIAHMWFGNLVTPKWWSELWLKEGFANFMGFKAIDEVAPSWNAESYFAISGTHYALQADSLESSHPINVEVGHPDRISEIFDAISYNKGASIIRMMHYFLTGPVFQRGMTNYLTNLQFDNAVQDDLWRYLTESWNMSKFYDPEREVKTVMDTWTLQDGYPLLSVKKNETDIIVTQERFLTKGNLFNDTKNATKRSWWVPISYTNSNTLNFEGTEPKVWMSPQEMSIVIENMTASTENWYIFNIKKTGFYRVNYDEENWSKLKAQLLLNHSSIHPLNRAQLIDDAFNLARAGVVNYSLPLSLCIYMKMERELIPWETFFNNYNYVHAMTKTATNFLDFEKYLLDIVVPQYNITGFDSTPTDDVNTQRLRILSTNWACKVGHQLCLITAKNTFDLWLSLPKNQSSTIIDVNIKPTVLCYGIKTTSQNEWNKTFEIYLQSNSQAEKIDILFALGCSTDLNTLQRYLDMSLDPNSGILKQDTFYVFQAVSSSREGRLLTWNLIKNKWEIIFEYLGSGSNALGRILSSPTTMLNYDEFVNELKEFGKRYQDKLGAARQTYDQVMETATINAAWITNILPNISF